VGYIVADVLFIVAHWSFIVADVLFIVADVLFIVAHWSFIESNLSLNRPLRKLNLPPDNVISRHEKSHSE